MANIPLPNGKVFYSAYFIEHFRNRSILLDAALKHFDRENPLFGDVPAGEEEMFVYSAKLEMHFLLYQMIETLFALFFGLKDLDDEHLWYHISKQKKPTEDGDNIQTVSDESSPLLSLETFPTLTVPFIEYVFFFNVPVTDSSARIQSVIEIRKILIELATIFGDRKGYNAYKHGFRLFQEWHSLELHSSGESTVHRFELTDPFTFLGASKDGSAISQYSESIDTKRDYWLADVCYKLIDNLISTRKAFYFHETVHISSFIGFSHRDIPESGIALQKLQLTSKFAQQTIPPVDSQPPSVS